MICLILPALFSSLSLPLHFNIWHGEFRSVAVLSITWMLSYYRLSGGLIGLQYHGSSQGKWILRCPVPVLPVTSEIGL